MMMTHRIRIARPPVIVRQIRLQIQAEETVPRDILQELSNRTERYRCRMLDTLMKNDRQRFNLDYHSAFIAFATYIVLPTAKLYIDVAIFLRSWCSDFKFPFLSTALIEAVLLVIAFLYIKTWFVFGTTCIVAFKLGSLAHWLMTRSQSKWSLGIMRLLANIENFLETKSDSWRLYLLDRLDRFLPPDSGTVKTVDTAKDNSVVFNSTGVLDKTVPGITRRFHATRGFDCGLPILERNCGLDQEGWLFVTHPIIDFEVRSTDPSIP